MIEVTFKCTTMEDAATVFRAISENGIVAATCELPKTAHRSEAGGKRMRTADQAFRQMVKDDPDTNVSKCMIGKIIKQELIPVTHIGKKRLIDYDQLLNFLSNPTAEAEPEDAKHSPTSTLASPAKKQKDYGKIRRIDI